MLWEDFTKNVVLSSELMFRGVLKKGTKVKMFYEKKWYNGKVILTECDINISDEHNSDYVPVPTKEVNKLDVKSASEFRNQVDIPDVDSLSDSSDNVPLAQIKAMILSESLNNQKMAISDDNKSEISEPSLSTIQMPILRIQPPVNITDVREKYGVPVIVVGFFCATITSWITHIVTTIQHV